MLKLKKLLMKKWLSPKTFCKVFSSIYYIVRKNNLKKKRRRKVKV